MLQLFVVFAGKALAAKQIACSQDACIWIFTGFKGHLFFTLHIVVGMMSGGIARAVFVKTAKAQGIFAPIEEEESAKKDK